MKPLKTENEVSSNMKSIIRYTFVAPGDIGKGRGRGLKSLGEKGNTPSKSFLPQSSDLVKKYIKEIEISSMEKDRGQGLEKATIFTSQGMQTIYKNSMVHEKENMQSNTLFPTFDIQVETENMQTSSSNPTKHKFESVDMNDHHYHILAWMNKLWNKWRGHLHTKYVKDKRIQ
ncbi:hypothetical protein RDI58_024550 [Solanum bulbocastanum]|uniref:Uncharacterized protein n=1 Tax=Solanum bulbocastanum TaxID=147425 RepID=A0AAN8T232_SOLBU